MTVQLNLVIEMSLIHSSQIRHSLSQRTPTGRDGHACGATPTKTSKVWALWIESDVIRTRHVTTRDVTNVCQT